VDRLSGYQVKASRRTIAQGIALTLSFHVTIVVDHLKKPHTGIVTVIAMTHGLFQGS
jgi:uncharacterized membrane protein YgaE (UPF0421/DUF939 family)